MQDNHCCLFKEAGESFLKVIGDDVCKPCVENGNNKAPTNLEDPLACKCRCEKVSTLLETAHEYLELSKNCC